MNMERLQKIAALVKKAAAPDNAGFDEKPVAEKNGPDPQVPKEPDKAPAEPVVPQSDVAASPIEKSQDMTIQDIMSISARGFLGPEIFQAAMGGDPNAQSMIALTAANVAVKMGEIYSRQQQDISPTPVENKEITGGANK